MGAPATDGGRRLCLLFEAGRARYAIEATQVTEVARPDADRPAVRGVLPLDDLSVLLGGQPEPGPSLALVLDTSPTRAVRVRAGAAVADVSGDPHFQLTHDLAARIGGPVRGALLHGGQLFLELRAGEIGASCLLPGPSFAPSDEAPGPWLHRAEAAAGPVLAFESDGAAYAVPLAHVLHVAVVGPAFCPCPAEGGPLAGVLAHGQTLWPVYALGALEGRPPAVEAHAVLAEVDGLQLALSASRVLGVEPALAPEPDGGAWRTRAGTLVRVPDVRRLRVDGRT